MKKQTTKHARPWRETPDWGVDLIQYCYYKLDMTAKEVVNTLGFCSTATVYKYIQIPSRWNRKTKWVQRLSRFKGMPEPDINNIKPY